MRRRTSRRWRWLGLAVVLALAVVGVWLAAGRGVSAPGPRILFTELRGDRSILWLATARNPQERTQLAEVSHRYGFGIRARLSPPPKADRLAYTLVPPEAQDPATQSLLYLLDLEGGQSRELARGVDPLSVPLWSPQGDRVLFRRVERQLQPLDQPPSGGESISLWVVEASGQGEREVARDETALGLYPAGWTGDTIYYARLDKTGTDLMALDVGGALRQAQGTVRRLAHLSDGVARDFRLSPDGARLSYTQPRSEVYSLSVVELASGKVATLSSEANDHLSPIWRPDGKEVTYNSLAASPGVKTQTVDGEVKPRALAAPQGGFDLPLSWSSDGAYLAVRYLQGTSSQNVVAERLVVLAEDGKGRWEVTTAGYAEFLGWREG